MTSRLRHDALIALALTLVLGLMWIVRDWVNLAALRLPDTDDVMRLQQVRDWLGGQSWFDVAQHRLDGGLPMHWSRLADLGPALLITVLSPLFGANAATIAAVTLWPLMLFAIALLLIARVARSLGGEALAATAAIVAAIAYPATTIFMPGRIDHHGLQLVLLLAGTLALLGATAPRHAALAGLAAAASLVIGLETAPLLAVLGGIALYDWIEGEDRDGERLAAFAIGAFGGLVIGRIGFASAAWAYPACDGFTRDAWTAAMILAAAPVLLAGTSAQLVGARKRLIATLAIGGAGVAFALTRSPDCVSPYGRVDPLLARLWLAHVEEAQSILTAGVAQAIGYLGIMTAGLAATLWRFRQVPSRGWAMLLALQAVALAVSLVQLRGAYAGAMLAAPGLAAAIGHARVRGTMRLAMAWMLSAGIIYPLAGEALTPRAEHPPSGGGDCTSPAMLAALARLPVGTIVAPIDAGPLILAQTHHRVLAAPYHRDSAGIRAVYAYYTGRDAARPPGDYVLACAGLPGSDARGSVAAMLAHGGQKGLIRVRTLPDGATILTARLSKGRRTL